MDSKIGLHKAAGWLCQYWLDVVALGLLVLCLTGLATPLIRREEPQSDWVLVFLTGIYAVLTLYVVAGALRSAKAMEKSVLIMEASLSEQRMSRWVQFFPAITFPDGYVIRRVGMDEFELRLANLYSQPIMGLRVLAWPTEIGQSGLREVKFSSMATSGFLDLHADEREISVRLGKAEMPESLCRQIGVEALDRFTSVYGGQPASLLCAIMFNHRADLNPALLVYDLQIEDGEPQPLLGSS